jgi:hypothetical protein
VERGLDGEGDGARAKEIGEDRASEAEHGWRRRQCGGAAGDGKISAGNEFVGVATCDADAWRVGYWAS